MIWLFYHKDVAAVLKTSLIIFLAVICVATGHFVKKEKKKVRKKKEKQRISKER